VNRLADVLAFSQRESRFPKGDSIDRALDLKASGPFVHRLIEFRPFSQAMAL